MKCFRLPFALVTVLALTASLASAGSTTTRYDCRFYELRSGMIPETVTVTEDSASGEVTVMDAVIAHFVGKPITGKLMEREPSKAGTRVKFNWVVHTSNQKGQKARMVYTLKHDSGARYSRAKLTARPDGYDNVFDSVGDCTVTAG